MEYTQAKNIFNSVVFLLAGIISILKREPMEAAIAFVFCGIFFSILLILNKKDNRLLTEEYKLK